MRIKERLKDLFQLVGGVGYSSVLQGVLQFLLKVKAVAAEILNIVPWALAQIHQLPMLPAALVVVGLAEDIPIAGF
jgi:hypothetical protein